MAMMHASSQKMHTLKTTEIRLSNQITVELYDQLVRDLNIRNAWKIPIKCLILAMFVRGWEL